MSQNISVGLEGKAEEEVTTQRDAQACCLICPCRWSSKMNPSKSYIKKSESFSKGGCSAPCSSAQKHRTNFTYMESSDHIFTLLNSLSLWPWLEHPEPTSRSCKSLGMSKDEQPLSCDILMIFISDNITYMHGPFGNSSVASVNPCTDSSVFVQTNLCLCKEHLITQILLIKSCLHHEQSWA